MHELLLHSLNIGIDSGSTTDNNKMKLNIKNLPKDWVRLTILKAESFKLQT